MNPARLRQLRDQYRSALLDDVVPFWMRHGVDREHGGFFTGLDRTGALYSTDKPVWFVGRATWLWATLYRTVAPRPEWLDLARHGHDFMRRHCFDPHGKMYFLVDRTGRPLRMRRYAFSEVFAVLALAALAQATGDERLRGEAFELFERLLRLLRTPGATALRHGGLTRRSEPKGSRGQGIKGSRGQGIKRSRRRRCAPVPLSFGPECDHQHGRSEQRERRQVDAVPPQHERRAPQT